MAYSSAAQSTPLDVLIVDADGPHLQRMLSAVTEEGFSARVATDFGELKNALRHFPATVVLELLLDDVDGIEWIRHFAGMIKPPELVIVSRADARIRDAAKRLAEARGLIVRATLEKNAAAIDPLLEVLANGKRAPRADRGQPTFVPTTRDLRHGMANGEISVLFQPKVDVQSLKFVSVEALARWQHPTRGAISPEQFISIAERNNLIGPLTDIVVHDSFASARNWLEEGVDIRLSFNVSGASLANLTLPDHLAHTAGHFGLDPHNITVEITEGWIEQNPIDALDIMTRLRMKEFELSIDDFGTGYSTMLRLRQVPFSELKLDRSLIRGAATDDVARLIVAASIELGRSLGLQVVAEGVDNQDDWDLICDLGCDQAQGYFVARPMAADALLDWHNRWQCSLGG